MEIRGLVERKCMRTRIPVGRESERKHRKVSLRRVVRVDGPTRRDEVEVRAGGGRRRRRRDVRL